MKVLTSINSYNDLKNELDYVKHNPYTFLNNLFVDYTLWENAFEEGRILIYKTNSTLWILKKNNGFCDLFYSCSDLEGFKHDLVIILDDLDQPTIVTTFYKELIDEVKEFEYITTNFKIYSTFNRMSNSNFDSIKEHIPNNQIKRADYIDIPQIQCLFNKVFDKYDDKIPDNNLLKHYIKNEYVRVIRNDDKVIACLIATIKGATSQFQYITINDEYQNRGYGSIMMKEYLYDIYKENVKRSLLWVKSSNKSAIKYYSKHSFKNEGLYKTIMIYGV